MVKSGDISVEAKINFSEDGSISKDYVIDGDLENVKLRLLNKDIIENIKFGFILKNNDYVIYNASSFYQDIKFKSDEIRIKEKDSTFLFNGNISTSKNDLNLKVISKIFQLDFESIKNDKIVFIRVEQLYPFPAKTLAKILKRYKNANFFWCQEEPKNMGAWFSVRDYIQWTLETIKAKNNAISYIGRSPDATPATGYARRHNSEQQEIINKVFE